MRFNIGVKTPFRPPYIIFLYYIHTLNLNSMILNFTPMKRFLHGPIPFGRSLVMSTLFAVVSLLITSIRTYAQAPCDATFTGLPAQMCSADASSLLVPVIPGGTFTGPGITGSTFNPTTAGVGTHTISYAVSQPAGATYAHSVIPYVAPPVVTNLVTLGDDQMSTSFPIGFSFNFYGNTYTQFEISSNGFITFDLAQNLSGCCQGQLLPDVTAPNNVIAGVWDDLYPPGNGTVGYGLFGTAPNQYLVISWTNTPFCCGSNADVTTTIILYETSNVIEIHSSFVNSASPATMGIEGAGGANGMAVPTFNQSTINIGVPEAHRFTPIGACSLNTSSQTITVIQSPTVTVSATNPNICPGLSTTLSANGASTYVWNPGNQPDSNYTVSPTATTIYTVTATGANGCIVSATQTINVSNQLPIAVTSNPAVLCGGSSATLTATGASIYTWQPGNLSGASVSVSPSTTTSYTVNGSDALGCTGSAIFSLPVAALNNLSIAANQNPCTDTLSVVIPGGAAAPANGAKYYIRDADPWGTANNTTAMSAVFGAANYQTLTYTTAVPATVFSNATQFVFLEGSDANALALNTFFTTNQTLIENWVFNGGRLYLNAAPNQGTNMNWGFGGVILNYTSAQSTVNAVSPTHPVFVGPYTPLVNTLTGGSYSHAHITGGNTTAIITGGGVNVLTEKNWGSGLVLFGGITSPNFHQPAVEAQNLWQNIINYTTFSTTALSYTFSWSNNSTNNFTIPTAPGTYTVTVTGYGCSGSATYTVNSITPTVSASAAPTSFCLGGNATLTATGANSYTWQPGNLTGNSVTVTPTTTTVYTVTGTNGANCSAVDTAKVTVNPIPQVSIVQQGVNCNDSLKAIVTGLGSVAPTPGARYYIRDADPWATTNNTTAMTAVFGPNYTTTSYAGAVPATVFSSGTQFVFLEGSDANATALNTFFTANQTLIENWVNNGGRLFMNAAPNAGANMNWGFGGVTLNYNSPQNIGNAVSPTHPIFVGPSLPTATTLNGNSYSHAHITGGNTTTVINGGGVNILTEKNWGSGFVMFSGITSPNFHTPAVEAQNVWQNIINYTANGAAGGPVVSYLWNTNATTSFIVPPTSGTYTVTVSANGCSATATYTAIVNNPPVVLVTTNTPTICPGQSAVLIANGAASYTWQPGNLTGNAITVNPTVTTIYTITGTSAGGCTASTVFTMNVSGQIPINATASPSTICIAGISNLQATGGNTYIWQPGNLSGPAPSVSPVTSTTYTVTGTNANGCTGTATVAVTVSGNPTIGASAAPSNSICQGDPVTLNGTGGTTYTWSGGVTNGVAFVPNVTTTYTVTGANAAGCTNNATILVTVNPNTAPPALTISCLPFPAIVGTSTTYTANIPGTIANYTIRWYRNNSFYQQTTSPTNTLVFTPTGLQDSIHAQIIPTGCFNPDSVKTNSINPRFNTGLGDMLPDGFALYPNPTHDQVQVSGLKKGDELNLTDMVGRTLFTKSISSNDQYVISLKAYANGVYFARFTRNNQSWTIRVVKD